MPPGGPVPAVPFDGHCRANLASWLVRCRASPSESVGFGIVDGRRLCFPLSLPPQPTPDHPHAPGRSEPYGRGGQDTTAHGDPERALVVPSEVVRTPATQCPRGHARTHVGRQPPAGRWPAPQSVRQTARALGAEPHLTPLKPPHAHVQRLGTLCIADLPGQGRFEQPGPRHFLAAHRQCLPLARPGRSPCADFRGERGTRDPCGVHRPRRE